MNTRSWVVSTAALAVLAAVPCVAALAPERTLAGVTVGSKGVVVLRRYGNPTTVSPGLDERAGFTSTTANPATPANPYQMGPGGTPPGVPPTSPYSRGGYPGAGSAGGSGYPGGYRPQTGPYPTSSLPPAGAESATNENGETVDSTGLVTWTYRKSGPILNFRIDEDGRVVEVVANGYKPSPLARTSRGITLGDPYGKVLRVYGFPEDSIEQGNVLTVKYSQSTHVAFRFYKLKVVGIAVALPKKATNAAL